MATPAIDRRLNTALQTSAALLGALVGHMLGASAWPLAAPMAIMGTLALIVWIAAGKPRAGGAKGST